MTTYKHKRNFNIKPKALEMSQNDKNERKYITNVFVLCI